MGSFGERMKRERELRGITLEEIAESTKIGTRNLVALEGEDFDALPGGIFNKGFVRAYCKFLGIDQEQAVTDFLSAYQKAKHDSGNGDELPVGAVLASMVKPPAMPSEEQIRRKNRLWALTALLCLVAGLGAWIYVNRHPALLARSGSEPQQPSSLPPAAVRESQVSSAAPPTTSSAATLMSAPEVAAVAGDSSFVLNIRAKQDTWIVITADGQEVMHGILGAAGERSFRAKNELVVKAGNAGAIEIAHNGKSLPLLGHEGQVRTLVFTSQGLQR